MAPGISVFIFDRSAMKLNATIHPLTSPAEVGSCWPPRTFVSKEQVAGGQQASVKTPVNNQILSANEQLRSGSGSSCPCYSSAACHHRCAHDPFASDLNWTCDHVDAAVLPGLLNFIPGPNVRRFPDSARMSVRVICTTHASIASIMLQVLWSCMLSTQS